MGLTPFLNGEVTKDCELGAREMTTESGGQSSDTSAEPALASPRLIPIPESPKNSEDPSFPPALEDSGQPSNSFDKQRAPSQALECVRGNYDNLSYYQIHNLCKDRGYHKKDAKAALKTRLEAMDAVERRLIIQNGNAMDTFLRSWANDTDPWRNRRQWSRPNNRLRANAPAGKPRELQRKWTWRRPRRMRNGGLRN